MEENVSTDVKVTAFPDTTSAHDILHSKDIVPEVLIWSITFLLVLISVGGTFGNLLIVLSVYKYKKLRTIPNLYVLSLAICDLVVCFFLIPYRIYSCWHKEDTKGCTFVAYFSFALLPLSILNMTAVAFNRFILVTKSRELYSRMYSIRNVNISIVLIWIICFSLSTPPFAGFGEYGYNKKLGSCLFVDGDWTTYWFVQSMGNFVTALPSMNLTLYIYVKIMLNLRERRRKINVENKPGIMDVTQVQTLQSVSFAVENNTQSQITSQTGGMQKLRQKQRDRNMKVVLNMFIVWFTFVCCWIPIIILYMVDVYSRVSATVYHILMTFAMLNSSLNPAIYAGMNRTFRKAFINLIRCRDNEI